MTYSSLTNQFKPTAQQSTRQGATIDTFLIHHQAGTNDDATINAMQSGSRQVSANYTISNEGRLTCVVPEEYRAWTSGSSSDGGKGAAWDRRSITVEIENESAGGTWPISAAAIETAAKLLNDLRRRYPIARVLGHRDLWTLYRASYATFCPGPEKVGQITARAAALAGGATPLPPVTTPAGTGTYNGYSVKLIQQLLTARGFPTAVDGIYGTQTTANVRAFQRTQAITADGIVGPVTWAKLNSPGVTRPTIRRGSTGSHVVYLQQKLGGLKVDGIFGPATEAKVRTFQRAKGIAVDGIVGPQTWSRIG